MWEQILVGVLTGVGYSLVGWKKPSSNYILGNDFDWKKLGKGVLICGLVGGVAGYSGQDFSLLLTGTVGIGLTKAVDLVVDYVKSWLFVEE